MESSQPRVPSVQPFLIHHGSENRIKEVRGRDALERILPVTSIPLHDSKATEKILNFCDRLVSRIPAYDLHFRQDVEVANVLRNL